MRHLLYLLPLLACFACTEEPDDFELDFGYNLQPLEVGREYIYAVDSVIYDPLGAGERIDTVSGLAREVYTGLLDGAAGDTLYRIERSWRDSVGQAWRVTDVWTARRTGGQLIRTEENLDYVKLVFPLRDNSRWEANRFDELRTVQVAGETLELFKGWRSEVTSTAAEVTLAGNTYRDVVTVQLADEDNLVELRRGFEQYAPNVGLVYRELAGLDTQCGGNPGDCIHTPWEQKAEKGFIVRQTLLEFR